MDGLDVGYLRQILGHAGNDLPIDKQLVCLNKHHHMQFLTFGEFRSIVPILNTKLNAHTLLFFDIRYDFDQGAKTRLNLIKHCSALVWWRGSGTTPVWFISYDDSVFWLTTCNASFVIREILELFDQTTQKQLVYLVICQYFFYKIIIQKLIPITSFLCILQKCIFVTH